MESRHSLPLPVSTGWAERAAAAAGGQTGRGWADGRAGRQEGRQATQTRAAKI